MSEPEDAPVTLDQLRVFLRVVEEGSFSKAAERLRRVQSAVSYSIANLERLLDVTLFDRSGRRPVLTEAGAALLADARAVDMRIDKLRARAKTIASGVEPRLSLAVDALFPMPTLINALREFRERYEGVELTLRSETLGAVASLVTAGTCQLGISLGGFELPSSLTVDPLTHVSLVPVCAPGSPLATADDARELAREDLQIVVLDRSDLTSGRDLGVVSSRTWRVTDLYTKRELLIEGFGWGRMPEHLARSAIEAGELVELDLGEGGPVDVPLYAVHRTADPPGPAASWLLSYLADPT